MISQSEYDLAVAEMECETCKHIGAEHNYSPSGCGTEHCLHGAFEDDEIACDCKQFVVNWGDSYSGPTPLLD